ncbi:hypothetical protein HT747_06115 [Brevibacillus borstelensis]|uniref:hypothetical protein n=1 Tax=Brevibacillus borstelensis TaxID=45462 RepID=UPI00156210B3|nr:hypothetical protein [Brevibacillus borstelensis]MBE5394722.1 hypothetical protein [Brevibacillus borstelensis]
MWKKLSAGAFAFVFVLGSSITCILQLKNAEFGGQFMQNTANINTKEFRKTSCWIEHGAVGSFLR